jgi:hypothetical protein
MSATMKIEWSKPDIFGIKWDNGANKPASPLTEIDRDEFLRLFFCGAWGLDGLNFGGSAPLLDAPYERGSDGWLRGMYRWHYYFFHRYALAVAERFGKQPDDSRVWLPHQGHGYDVRFYRLGCLHPNLKSEWVAMHDRRDICPDCGFSAAYDTSG